MIDLGHGEAERHGPELETALYRITQEALTNARKHGGASRALVDIRASDHCLDVSVCDDGNGFDSHARTDGFGLHGHARTRRTRRRNP
jgi:signal transduction histidine kinase